jgi:RND family efflux transporter MFP subunit
MNKPLIAGAVLLAGIAAFAYLRSGSAPASEPPAPSVMVSTIQLVQADVPVQIPASGGIIAGTAEQNITLAAPGIVTAVLVRPGQSVVAGQALARIGPDAQAAADLRKAQDAVNATQAARAHVAALLAGHLATSADLAAATQAAQDAQANLQALQAQGSGVGRVVSAPFTGIVTSVAASPGGTSPAGSILFKLAAPGGLIALAGLPEAQAARITPGDAATLTALNTGAKTAAIVRARAAMLDPQTGLVDIILRPQSPLPLGEPLALSITAGSVGGYQVPRDAVLNDEQGDYVFQLDAQGIAHRKTAHVLAQDGPLTVLAPDLDPSMPLVTTGAYQLTDGMAATVQGSGH